MCFCLKIFIKKFFLQFLFCKYRVIKDVDNDECAVPAGEGISDYFRPPVDCNLCKDVKGLTVVDNITPVSFL